MKEIRSTPHTMIAWLRSYWVGLVGLILTALLLAAGRTATAAPSYQTVPDPTPPPTTAPPATATPSRSNSDRDEEPSPPPAATPQAAEAQTNTVALTGVVTANRLNVRAGPGVNSAIIGAVVSGETLQILGRNADSQWWRICCASGTTTEGWVSAQFVRLNVDAAQANELLAVIDPAAVAPAAAPVEAAPAGAPMLAVDVEQVPAFAWQGQQFILRYRITNLGQDAALALTLRDELPSELTLVEALADGAGAVVAERAEAGQLAFAITWPELAAGASVSVLVRIQVDAAVPDGAIIDNLAVVTATGGEPYTVGATIGMPPASLPLFQ